MAIQLRRGTQAQRLVSEEVLEAGQPYMDTDTGYLFIGDGTTKLKSLSRVIRPKAKRPPVVFLSFGGNPSTLSTLQSTSGGISVGTVEDVYNLKQGDIIRVDFAMGIGAQVPFTLAYIQSDITNNSPTIPENDIVSTPTTYYFWGHAYGGLWGYLTINFSGNLEDESLEIAGISFKAETGAACRYVIADQGYDEAQEVYGPLEAPSLSTATLEATNASIDNLTSNNIHSSSIVGTTSVIGSTVGVGGSTSYETVHPLYKHEVTAYSQNSSDMAVARVFYYSANPNESTASGVGHYGIYIGATGMFNNDAFLEAFNSPDSSPFQSVSGYIQIGTSSFTQSRATYPIIGFASDEPNGKSGFWYIDGSHYIQYKVLTYSTWQWTDNISQVK